MTVAELIEALSEMDQDAEVRLAIQPAWAIEYTIENVGQVEGNDEKPSVVYLSEGFQIGYLPSEAHEAIGW